MKFDVLKKILTDSRSVAQHKQCDVREYSFDDNSNYILYGIRRSGKSAIMCERARILHDRGVAWEQIFYLDFTDECFKDFVAEEFDMLLLATQSMSPGKTYFFFDEISRIPGWENYILKFAKTGAMVYASGSDETIGTERIRELLGSDFKFQEIYTYGFKEYLLANNVPFDNTAMAQSKTQRLVEDAFNEYKEMGGFPYSGTYLRRREYIETIFQNDIMADVLSSYNIRNPLGFRLILRKIAENVGKELPNQKLHGQVATAGVVLPREVFTDYISYAKNGFIVFALNNYYTEMTEKKPGIPKYYFTDIGLLNLMIMNNDESIVRNIVAILLKRKYGNDVKYYKSGQLNIDLDFFLPERRMAVIVSNQFQGNEYKHGLISFGEMVQRHPEISNLYVITGDKKETIDYQGIKICMVPILDVLLQNITF